MTLIKSRPLIAKGLMNLSAEFIATTGLIKNFR
jgi:hypothetical protein